NADVAPLYEERFHFIAVPAISPGPSGRPIPFAEIGAAPLVAPDRDHDLRRRIEDVAMGLGLPLAVRYEANSIGVHNALVRAGLAAAIVPPTGFQEEIAAGTLTSRPVIAPEIIRVQALAWPAGRTPTQAARAVADTLHAVMSEMAEAGALPGRLLGVP
ncbi:MAG: LysR substrate-binding domain-containing protein, partial [Pseudomonadota bacterium]